MNPSLEKDSMSRIRICQMITELGLAGAERCVYELSERLNKDRFDVQVVAMRGGKVAEWLREAGIKVTGLGVRAAQPATFPARNSPFRALDDAVLANCIALRRHGRKTRRARRIHCLPNPILIPFFC